MITPAEQGTSIFRDMAISVELLQANGCLSAVELVANYAERSPDDWQRSLEHLEHNGIGIDQSGTVLSLFPEVVQYGDRYEIDPETADWLNIVSAAVLRLRAGDPNAYAKYLIKDDGEKDAQLERAGDRLYEIHTVRPEIDTAELIVLHPELLHKKARRLIDYPTLVEAYGDRLVLLENLSAKQLAQLETRAYRLDTTSADYMDCLDYLLDDVTYAQFKRELHREGGMSSVLLDKEVVKAAKELKNKGLTKPIAVPRLIALRQHVGDNIDVIYRIIREHPEFFTIRYMGTENYSNSYLDAKAVTEIVAEARRINQDSAQRRQRQTKQHQAQASGAVASQTESREASRVVRLVKEAHLEGSRRKISDRVAQYPAVASVNDQLLTIRLLALQRTFGPQLSHLILEDYFAYLTVGNPQGIIQSLPFGAEQRDKLTDTLGKAHNTVRHRQHILDEASERLAQFDTSEDEQLLAKFVEECLASYRINLSVRDLIAQYPPFTDQTDVELTSFRAQALVEEFGPAQAKIIITKHPDYLVSIRPVASIYDWLTDDQVVSLRKRIKQLNDQRYDKRRSR